MDPIETMNLVFTILRIGKKIISFFASLDESTFEKSFGEIDSLIFNLNAVSGAAEGKIQEISNKLRNTKKTLSLMRNDIRSLALETITKTDQLLGVLSSSTSDAKSMEYTARRMVNLVNRSLNVLGNFEEKYTSLNEEISSIMADLEKIDIRLDDLLKSDLTAEIEAARHKQYEGLFNVIMKPFIRISFESALKNKETSAKVAAASASNSKRNVSELISRTQEVDKYIDSELSLLGKWKCQLNEMSEDFSIYETLADAIERDKEGIVTMLQNLKQACIDYIAAGSGK